MSGVDTLTRDLSSVLQGSYSVWYDQTLFKPWNIHLPGDQATTSFRSSVQDVIQDELAFGKVTYNPLFATDPDDKSDRGHEFNTVKRVCTLYPQRVRFTDTYDGDIVHFDGAPDFYMSQGQEPSFAVIGDMTDNDLKFYGTTAISSCEPTNPAASLSTFLGEIFLADKEIPHFNSEAWLRASTGGGHVGDLIGDTALIVEFAFKPFLNDVKKLMNNVRNSYKLIQQYKKDAGKPIRRRFRFPPQESTFIVPGFQQAEFNAAYPYATVNASIDAKYTQYLRTEYWFSGSFMYALPIGDDLLSRFARYDQLANAVLGSDFTPLTLWNLAPYSWLVDWFTDVGNAISISESMTEHGLVLQYGYLMKKTTSTNQVIATFSFPGGKSRVITKTFSLVKKERRRATPYGFGVNTQEFTPEQIAILLSLGLSRGLLNP